MAHLEERKAKLEHYWAEYNEVQSHLESLDESEDCDRDGFEEAFYALSASSFSLRRHCECPSFLCPLQVFVIQIVVRTFGYLS